MEWPKFGNVIGLGLPHENWSFTADLRTLFLDPAPLDTASSSSSRLPGYAGVLLAAALIVMCCTVLRRVAARSPMSSGKFEQPLTRRLQTSCHDLIDPLDELVPKRVISFGVFAQNCPDENNGGSGLTSTSADTPLVRRE